MGFLQGRRILVTGMLSNRSIAYGIARACRREGAELAFTYAGEGLRERVADLAKEFDSALVLPCDVADDAQIEGAIASLRAHWDSLDGLVHAIAFAPREALKGPFHESVSREAFRIAHDISSYSLAALAKAAAPMMKGRPASIVTLTYLGAERAIRREPGTGVDSRERDLRGADQDARRRRHRQLLEDPALRGEERAAAPRRHRRGGGQHRRIPALGPRERRHRRGDLRRRGVQHHHRGFGRRVSTARWR
jgi:NAD(P)-dependent dehydrogenase (short-subunit alcohol dehydrogenase family)